MNKYLILLLAFCLLNSCKKDKKETAKEALTEDVSYLSFGEKIHAKEAMSAAEMYDQYKSIKVGDTIISKAKTTINEVCSKKGCWMKLDLNYDEEVMVRFKDYGFFMPLDAKGEVIINGKAFVSETSIEELRHYAEDAGKTKEEIEAIIEPEITYGFEADGVLLKE